jgi:hypothetical protein
MNQTAHDRARRSASQLHTGPNTAAITTMSTNGIDKTIRTPRAPPWRTAQW